MLTYKFKYKRLGSFFWKTYVVKGHGLEFVEEQAYNEMVGKFTKYMSKPNNAMVVYLPDNSIVRIPKWDECQLKLGSDWALAQKNAMEQEIGQPIQLKG
jgi:hypothetical protein